MKVSDVWLKNTKWLKKNYDTENLLTNYKKPMEVNFCKRFQLPSME